MSGAIPVHYKLSLENAKKTAVAKTLGKLPFGIKRVAPDEQGAGATARQVKRVKPTGPAGDPGASGPVVAAPKLPEPPPMDQDLDDHAISDDDDGVPDPTGEGRAHDNDRQHVPSGLIWGIVSFERAKTNLSRCCCCSSAGRPVDIAKISAGEWKLYFRAKSGLIEKAFAPDVWSTATPHRFSEQELTWTIPSDSLPRRWRRQTSPQIYAKCCSQ